MRASAIAMPLLPWTAFSAAFLASLCVLALESHGSEFADSATTSARETVQSVFTAPELAQWLKVRAGKNPLQIWGEKQKHETSASCVTAEGFDLSPKPFMPWPAVERVDVRGSNFGRWALIGGITAEALMVASASYSGNANDPEAAIGWVGAPLIGMTIGGLAGAFSHHWSRIWTRPADWGTSPGAAQVAVTPVITGTTPAVTPGGAPPAASGASPSVTPPIAGASGRSPVAAMRIGLISTAAPIVLGTVFRTVDNEKSVLALLTIGAFAGPAIGLASGGRGDLAVRGLWRRSLLGVVWLGAWTVADNSKDDITVNAAKVVAGLGALGFGVSAIHDLLITRSAVEEGRPPRVSLDVRGDRRLALSAHF